MTRQKAPWSFAAVDIEVPSSGTREVLLTRASGDWTGWTVDGVTAPASVTDELTVTAPSSLLGRRWRLLDPDGRERIVGWVVAAKAGSASEDLTVDVSTGATIVEVTIAGGGGGGAVTSVNGETGVVVLDAGDVGADPAGSAAAVAGDLATHEGLTTTAHGGIVASTDPRLTDARTPTAHTHAQGDVTGLTADLAAKAPTSRLITAGTGLSGGGDLTADRTLTVTYGTSAGTAAQGNDARLSDARTPTAHEASHHHDGSDPLDAGDVGAVPVESVGLLPGETNRGTWDVAETYAVGDVVAASGSVYVASAASTGLDPASNPGSWDGIVDLSYRRIALGPGSSATGAGSTAIGYGSSATDAVSIAIGTLSSATGDTSTAIGMMSSATGDMSTAIGPGSSATGAGSTAIGYTSSATGDGDINIGDVFRGRVDDPLGARTPDAASITTGFVDLPETAVATNPAADHQRLIARTDGLYVRDQAGTEVGPLGAGGSASHPSLYRDATRYQLLGLANPRQGSSGELFTATAGSAFWWLIMPMEAIGVTGAEVYCQTGGAAGAKARLWLYPVTAGVPSGAPLIDSGDMDVTASGYKAPTWSRVNLSAHTLYAAAIITNDSAVQFRHWQGAATSDVGIPLGGSGSGARAHSLRSIAVGYGAPPGTAPAVGIAGDHPPACFWIVAR